MSKDLVISKNCYNFKVLKIKVSQTIITVITEDRIDVRIRQTSA